MESLLIILISILIIVNIGMFFLLIKKKTEIKEDKTEQVFKDEINALRNSFSQSFGSMSKDIAKDMTGALTRVDEKVGVFNKQVEVLNKSQENFSRILAGVKQYGVLAEFSLASLLKDLLPASQFIENVKMKPDETSDTVEFAIKLQDVLVPIDSHWPVEKFKAIDDAYQNKDKEALADARKDLAAAFKNKAKAVSSKYIAPPKTTDFAIVYAPTESLFSELSSYQDPINKELLTQELMKKYKVVILGPNTLSAYLQSLHMGFQTLKVQKHATEIYDHLKTISTRFSTHFDNIYKLRKKLEEAMTVVDSFGKDARAISRSIEVIKNPSDDDDPDSPTPISSAKQSEKRKVS